MRRIISLWLPVAFLFVLFPYTSEAQITSDGVSVRNSAPENVWFMFPVGSGDDVNLVQFGCSDSPANADWVFVDEIEPYLSTPSHQTVTCNINVTYNAQHIPVSMTGSLVGTLTVVTSRHTVTVDSASWTALYLSGRSGYYWGKAGGSAQITVSGLSSAIPFYPCGSKHFPCKGTLAAEHKPGTCWWDGKGADWMNIQCLKEETVVLTGSVRVQ